MKENVSKTTSPTSLEVSIIFTRIYLIRLALLAPPPTLPHLPTIKIKYKRAVRFCGKRTVVIIYHLFSKQNYSFQNTKVNKRQIQSYETVKFLWESVLVLYLKIYLTQPPAMIFWSILTSVFSLKFCKMNRKKQEFIHLFLHLM